MNLGECVHNELLYADKKWYFFSQNTPAQLLDVVTDLAQAEQKNICVPITTEAVLEIHSMQKGHHTSARQTCDSRADALLSPLPFQHHTAVLCLFPVVSMGALSRMCPLLSCTALGEQPHLAPWARQMAGAGFILPQARLMPACISWVTLLLPKKPRTCTAPFF